MLQALNKRVRECQQAKAVAVIIILNFYGADPFQLEENDTDTNLGIFIPAVMVRIRASLLKPVLISLCIQVNKEDGDLFKQSLVQQPALKEGTVVNIFKRVDSLSQQIITAQKYSVAGIIVQQREDAPGIDGAATGSPTEVMVISTLNSGKSEALIHVACRSTIKI